MKLVLHFLLLHNFKVNITSNELAFFEHRQDVSAQTPGNAYIVL